MNNRTIKKAQKLKDKLDKLVFGEVESLICDLDDLGYEVEVHLKIRDSAFREYKLEVFEVENSDD